MQLDYTRYLYLTWKTSGRLSIRAPWGSGKTIILLGFLAWVIGLNPSIRIKMICASKDLAVERVDTIRSWIENDEDYRFIFPEVVPHPSDWGKSGFKVAKKDPITGEIKGLVGATDKTLSAYGVTSSGIGGRVDLLVFDDLCDRRDVDSPAIRAQRKYHVRSVWLGRLDVGGAVISIATPWHTDDAIAQFTKPEEKDGSEFPTISYQVSQDLDRFIINYENWIDSLPDGPDTLDLPPWFMGVPGMKAKKKDLGSREFQRGFQLQPIDITDCIFSPDWIVNYELEDILKTPGYVLVGLDPAYGRRESATQRANRGKEPAYSGIIICLKTALGITYVLDMVFTRAKPSEVRKIALNKWLYWTDAKRFPHWTGRQFSFEVVGGGQATLYDELLADMRELGISIPLVEFHPVGPKNERIAGMVPEVEDARIRFRVSEESQKKLVDQLTSFPFGTYIDGADVLQQVQTYARNLSVVSKKREIAGGKRTKGGQLRSENF